MYCTVNGIRLYYEKTGEGTPIILLHGNGESHEIFDAAVNELSKTHTVYTTDSRCHGKSTDTEKISYNLICSDMIEFIKTMHIEKPIFYGFSDGGIVGLLIAVKEPDLLGKLIISGANLNPNGLKTGCHLSTWLVSFTGNKLYKMMAKEPDIKNEELEKIKVPTVVLAGERDVIKEKHTRIIASSIPDSKLEIIKGETHGSYIVHSEKLYRILQKYI